MSKNVKSKNNTESQPSNTEAPFEVVSPAASTPDAPPVTDTALAPVEPTATELAAAETTALANDDNEAIDDGITLTHLVKILPHKAKLFRRLHAPTEGEYETARAALPERAQALFDDLLERMEAESASETRTRQFRPLTIKLKQGTSNDENCPELCDSGGLYTSDGIVLTTISEAKAKKDNIATGIHVVLLASWTGRALFAPRVNNKVIPLTEFGDANSGIPYCRSLDQLVGAPVKAVAGIGKCPECPYRPWKVQGEPNLCNDSVSCVFVLLRQEADGTFTPFDGLYEMTFSKSAIPCGKKIINLAEKGRNPWERVLRITGKQESIKDGGGVYFVPEVAGVNNPTNGHPLTVGSAESAMLKLLREQILVGYYYPNLAAVYNREAKSRTGGEGPSTTRNDMSELERRAAIAAGETPAAKSDMRDANV